MDLEKKVPETEEYHYHYGTDAQDNHVSPPSKSTRELLDVTCKVALTSSLMMGAIFCGGLLLIGYLLIGGFTVFLGGGSVFLLGTSIYLLIAGVQQMMTAVSTGMGVCGFSLLIFVSSAFFTFGTVYWIRKIIPETMNLYRKLRIWMMGKKEDKQ